MPGPLLYPTLRDAKYVNQFVGSTFPELKEMRQALIERWDAAKETDSKSKALMLDMIQNVHPSNLETAQKVYEASQEKFKEREKAGNYEDLLHQTLDDARMLSTNVAKLSKNKQTIEDFQKTLNADSGINSERKKKIWENVVALNLPTFKFDEKTGAVVGNYFTPPPIQKDYDVTGVADKFLTGIHADGYTTSGAVYRAGVLNKDGTLRKAQPGEQELIFKQSEGRGWQGVDKNEVRSIAENLFKADPNYRAYMDSRGVEETNPQLLQIDKDPNLTQDQKDKLKKKIIDNAKMNVYNTEIIPAYSALMMKYGYDVTQNQSDIGFDAGASSAGKKEKPEFNPREVTNTVGKSDYKNVDLPKEKEILSGSIVTSPGGDIAVASVETDITPTALANARGDDGLFKYKGLSKVMELYPQKSAETNEAYLKRINPIYNSFSKAISNKFFTEENLGAESKKYTDMILGNLIESKGNKERTGGGYFLNNPIDIYQKGLGWKHYDSGRQAMEDEALTSEDLATGEITGFDHNFADFKGSYNANLKINNKPAVIKIGAGKKYQAYTNILTDIERAILQGENSKIENSKIVGPNITLNGEPVQIEVTTLAKDAVYNNEKYSTYTTDKKGNIESVNPIVKITYPNGDVISMFYSDLKQHVLETNPFKDPAQNKEVSNIGSETE